MSTGKPRNRIQLAQAAAGSLKPGGVVFFPTCKKTAKPNGQVYVMKGHGYGVFLGVVPMGHPEPTREMMDPLLAGVGWVSFENVIELLGEDQFKILEEKFRAKYDMDQDIEGPSTAEPSIALPPEKQLIGLDGKALKTEVEN